jgi:hypothetical protein
MKLIVTDSAYLQCGVIRSQDMSYSYVGYHMKTVTTHDYKAVLRDTAIDIHTADVASTPL